MDHWLLRAARMHPQRAALLTSRGELTYGQLAARAQAAAGGLLEQGVSTGDRVALELPAGEEFVVTLHACLLIGAVAVPVDLRLATEERARRRAGASVVVDAPLDGAPLAEAVALELGRIATVMHTSGTTSAPRAVELTCGNWLANAAGSSIALGLDLNERWLCAMPLTHVGGLSIVIRSAVYGTTAVLHERFDAELVTEVLADPGQGITLVSLVPTMLARLLDAALREPPSLRWALLGGAPCPESLLDRAQEAAVPVITTYGMTEACSQIATGGWPLHGVDVRVDSDGEVIVRGPVVAPAAPSPDGWLHTGDLGAFDDSGRLEITGRRAETIVTGGENVAPAEVEAVLFTHPAVADAAVHGRPDEEWGEAVVATVVVRDGEMVGGDELKLHCRASLAAFKVPKTVEFVDQLPRTETGKLLRGELR